VGAALTRLQTTNLQNALPELGRRVMSYGEQHRSARESSGSFF
jgi:hypothetical protein